MWRGVSTATCLLAFALPACSRTALPATVVEHSDSATPAPPLSEAGHAAHTEQARDPPVSAPRRDGEIVRFVVLGDGGTGDQNQRRVGLAVRAVCSREGCDFALYLGDNIYEVGVGGVDDAQFVSKFEAPFAELDFPFYVVLGNHDYGSSVPSSSSFEPSRVDAQIEYTAHSHKWNMPSRFYAFELGPAAFFALDTGAFVYDFRGEAAAQQIWLDQQLRASPAPWKIVFGHHPYISNGYHGNAGNYEGTRGTPSTVYPTGAEFAALVEHSVCGKAHVYFAGHDHDRQWLEPVCGTQFIVSGAAAKLRPLASRDGQPSQFQDDSKHGFLWVELDRERFTGVFYDEFGQADYRRTIARP